MSFAGYSTCRIQFIPNNKSLPSRNYSDRTLVELKQYDFGDYSIDALDIDNKNAEIFNIRIKSQDQYKMGQSANQPDEISDDNGIFRLWLNDASRKNFHDALGICFEQIRAHQTRSPSPPPKQQPRLSTDKKQQSTSYRTAGSIDKEKRRSPTPEKYSSKVDGKQQQNQRRKQSSPSRRSRSPTPEKPNLKASGRQQSNSKRRQSPKSSKSRSPTPEKPNLKVSGRQQSNSKRRQSPKSSTSRSPTPEKYISKVDRKQQQNQRRKQSSPSRRSRSPTPEKPSLKASGRQQSNSKRRQSPESSKSRSPTPAKHSSKIDGKQQQNPKRKQSPSSRRSRSPSADNIGSSNTGKQISTGAKSRDSYATTTTKPSAQRVHHSPKPKQRLNRKDVLVNIYELGKYIREGNVDGATETTQKLADQGVHLQVRPSNEEKTQQKFRIEVKIDSNDENFCGQNEKLIMNVYPSTTVRELRTIFERCDNIPAQDQHFFVNGHLAHDVSTMAELNVEQDTLFVLFVVRK